MILIRRSRLFAFAAFVICAIILLQRKKSRQSPIVQHAFEYQDAHRQDSNSLKESPKQIFEKPEFHLGIAKPPGSTYTKAVVVGHTSSQNATWLEEADLPSVQNFIYVVDDSSAVLHTPVNKGNEAMVYLTFIIDHYDTLPDITMFMHAHRMAWHTNELLNHDALEVIKRLSSEHVTREGYMNLRCHWDPGCPDRIHPHNAKFDENLLEEHSMAQAWIEMFPTEPVPDALGAPCCAQFALSKQRIHAIPLERYRFYRDWLVNTSLSDWTSGRIFEYLWQKIFTDKPQHCPDMRICYCDGFGVCFPNANEFEYWFELRHKHRQLAKELTARKDKAINLDAIEWRDIEKKLIGMQSELDAIFIDLQARRREALHIGKDPKVRAQIAGRRWKEGDGF